MFFYRRERPTKPTVSNQISDDSNSEDDDAPVEDAITCPCTSAQAFPKRRVFASVTRNQRKKRTRSSESENEEDNAKYPKLSNEENSSVAHSLQLLASVAMPSDETSQEIPQVILKSLVTSTNIVEIEGKSFSFINNCMLISQVRF